MKYTLIGAGAIGGSMAAYVSRAGGEILYVDAVKEHVDALNEKGMTIVDPKGEDFTVPVKAKLIDDLNEPLDIVFLATKSQHTRSVMEKISPLLKKDGVVVSLQNGLNEYIIAEYVGEERVIGAFVNWAADYIEPGVIRFGGHSNFVIGELNGVISERLLELQKFLSPFQKVDVSTDVMRYLWSKQVNINAMFATGISHLLIPGGMRYEPSQEAIACVALEAMQVPKVKGVELVEFDDFKPQLYKEGRYKEALEVTAAHYEPMAKNYTGLYRDLAVRHRKSEVDGTIGTTVHIGEGMGLKLPLSRKLVDMIHEIEDGKREICTENLLELQKEYEKLYPNGMEELRKNV